MSSVYDRRSRQRLFKFRYPEQAELVSAIRQARVRGSEPSQRPLTIPAFGSRRRVPGDGAL